MKSSGNQSEFPFRSCPDMGTKRSNAGRVAAEECWGWQDRCTTVIILGILSYSCFRLSSSTFGRMFSGQPFRGCSCTFCMVCGFYQREDERLLLFSPLATFCSVLFCIAWGFLLLPCVILAHACIVHICTNAAFSREEGHDLTSASFNSSAFFILVCEAGHQV